MMFSVFHDDIHIGDTDLAKGGDAPMGCAEGDFFPREAFNKFLSLVRPQPQEDPDYKIWNGLSLIMSDGRRVQCVDTVLHLVDYKGHVEMFIDALGIQEPPYHELFPQNVATYENQFKDQ